MGKRRPDSTPFAGFPDFRANVTFTPIQFFTVVVPHRSRGCVRIVGYALRKVLGWVDRQGNPTNVRLRFSYRELIEKAGVSRDCIADAIQDALDYRCLRQLQKPQRDRAGQRARSGIYELCWDYRGAYTDKPADFRGFYYPEAAMLPADDGELGARRPKSARKNIPNAYFDELLPCERLSVIRVVGALLFYSIKWGPGGERKVPVSLSIDRLCKLVRMKRPNVHAAVVEACRRGYIIVKDRGSFNRCPGFTSRASTYAIHWSRTETAAREVESDRMPTREVEWNLSEKVNGAPVGKSERELSEKVNGNLSEKVNDMSIKRDPKTLDTTTAAFDETAETSSAAAVEVLVGVGFDVSTARRLAQGHSLESIQRQVSWLSLRGSARNRLGLLRRAIEGDWPKPEAAETNDPELDDARTFASHYYAAYHNHQGQPGTVTFPKDIRTAKEFLERLRSVDPHPKAAADWGTQFGRFMRQEHAGDSRAKPNLSFSLVLHGDGFLQAIQSGVAARRKKALGKAQVAHEATFGPQWQAYLRAAEASLQERQAALYQAFADKRRQDRHSMTGGMFVASASTLARFDAEPARLAAFAEFFHNHPHCPVLDFWQWDQQLNPHPFGTKPGAARMCQL